MISFRLSEHEFEQLRIVSEAQGARSVSDYARVILCRQEVPGNRQPQLDPQTLHHTLQQLSHNLLRLVELLELNSGMPKGQVQARVADNGRDRNA